MDYRVCQDVNFEKYEFWCRGGPAAMCYNWPITSQREVCGEWRASEQDAYASFYTTIERATDCSRPGNSCFNATRVGRPEVETSAAASQKFSLLDVIKKIFR